MELRNRETLGETASEDGAQCELRCACGSLLARLVEGGVELKCRRCKRTTVLPLGGSDELDDEDHTNGEADR